MENPRPEKVAVVDEVRTSFTTADAALLTEYRGIDVAGMATLRRSLREAGGEYKIYKNTLVRFAARGPRPRDRRAADRSHGHRLRRPGRRRRPRARRQGAEGLRQGATRTWWSREACSATRSSRRPTTKALADVAPREVLLAQLAGLPWPAPMQQFASLLKRRPAGFAYGLQALIEPGRCAGAPTLPSPKPPRR